MLLTKAIAVSILTSEIDYLTCRLFNASKTKAMTDFLTKLL